MRRVQLLVPLLALALAAVGACGDDDVGPEAQPAPGVTVFAEGDFGTIPLLPRSEPVGTRSEQGGVVAQSFRLRNAQPQSVFDFYRERLEPEWTLIEEPHPLGEAENPSFRGIWHRGQQRLVVSVASADALGSGPGESDDPQIQYSLSLEPAGTDTFETDNEPDR